MVTTKRCAYGTCKNDLRYLERWERNIRGDSVEFYHFPGEKRQMQTADVDEISTQNEEYKYRYYETNECSKQVS